VLPKFRPRLAALLFLAPFAAAMTAASAADPALFDTRWVLVSVAGQPAVAARGEPHLILGADGVLAGSTGCNRMGGGFAVDGATIAFGPIRTTRMYCAEAYLTEQELLAALRAVAGWTVTGNRLDLIGRDGTTLASFVAT
jgi:heat shock protein HslJ